MDKFPPKKKIVSVDFYYAVFCLLDFLTLEAGTNRLSWYISAELTLPAA